jgi:hypothetical protein
MLEGDTSTFVAKGIEFGGGARFWVNDQLSFAPTIMGLYGHTTNTYTAVSSFMQTNLGRATQAGLVDYNVDTITIRTASDVQYLDNWGRTIITLTLEPVWFHTETLSSSNSNVKANGDSGTLAGIIDVDVPLRHDLFGHELRSGGYYRPAHRAFRWPRVRVEHEPDERAPRPHRARLPQPVVEGAVARHRRLIPVGLQHQRMVGRPRRDIPLLTTSI